MNVEIGAFTQGCDPEFFLYDPEFEEYVSAIPFVEGTKEAPSPLPNGGYVMRDNVAIEFGMPPANTMEQWIHAVNTTLALVRGCIPKEFELRIVPSANFPRQQLSNPEAQEIGCSPDFNAWTGRMNKAPVVEFVRGTFRSCGGHIHVGFVENSGNDFLVNNDDGKIKTIKIMDCMHGILSTILDSGDAAVARRKIYGKAGCFRPTKYGVEYRTLSNFWCTSDTLKKLMYFLTADALACVRNDKADQLIEDLGGGDAIQDIINSGDVDRANVCVDTLKHYLSEDTLQTYKEALNE